MSLAATRIHISGWPAAVQTSINARESAMLGIGDLLRREPLGARLPNPVIPLHHLASRQTTTVRLATVEIHWYTCHSDVP
jgi:hypothetical protein